jgi:hypothetical protein
MQIYPETEFAVLKTTLYKRQALMQSKIARYYVLREVVLYYYESREAYEAHEEKPKGFYNLEDYNLHSDRENRII